MTKRFCLMTVGRAGSTSLMEALERFDDIAVPNKNIECDDNELIHPRRLDDTLRRYSELLHRPIAGQKELVDAFFELNASYPYAGFKTMANRHKDYPGIFRRSDLRYLTLERRDIASTAASFLVAEVRETWRRHGEPQEKDFHFDARRWGKRVEMNINYMFSSHHVLHQLPRAIHLFYEDLCNPDTPSPELDAFFGRPIRLLDPKPPTSGASYVSNWEEMRAFVDAVWQRCVARVAGRKAQLPAEPQQ